MERVQAQPVVAETIAEARRSVYDQENVIGGMRLGDRRMAKAMVILQHLRSDLAAAEYGRACLERRATDWSRCCRSAVGDIVA